jgi:hypothetical protein
MATPPSSDWRRVPGASSAHLINAPGEQDPAPDMRKRWLDRLKNLLTKPMAWALTLVLGAIGGFATNMFESKAIEAIQDPILVYDVHQLTPPPLDESGYVVPGDYRDLMEVEWGEQGTPESGGLPDSEWAYEHGGTVAGWGRWEVILEAKRDTQITVTEIRAVDIECTEPSGGTLFIFAQEGETLPTRLGITIDAVTPEFKVLPEDWYLLPDPDQALTTFPAYGSDTVITLDKGEQHVVQFFAHAPFQSCQWAVELEYATGGKYETIRLAPEGTDAFKLAALLPTAHYETVVVPFSYCDDDLGHAVSGAEAERIITELYESNYWVASCT